jgi:membrane protein
MASELRSTLKMAARTLWTLARISAVEWFNDNTFRLSASLAFYTIFSMAPILLIAVSVASVWFGHEAAVRHLLLEIEMLVGSDGANAVKPMLEQFGQTPPSIGAGIVGFVVLAMGSTAVFAELQSALNFIWDVEASPRRGYLRGLLRDRLQSFAIVISVGFLLLVSLVLSASISAVQEILSSRFQEVPEVWRVLNIVVSFAMTSVLFALIYKYLPDVRITWRDVAIGAVVTAALFTVGKDLIGLYLGRIGIASSYGAAGSFVVLLIWVYYSALICFYGAEFTQVYARRFGSRIHPEPHAVRTGRKPTDLVD